MPEEAVMHLVPGGNIAIWPEVKLGRAYHHMMELQQRIEEWESLRPVRTIAQQIGPSEVQVKLEVAQAPPFEALAVIFGDAVHNLRAALDAVVWEMANFGESKPANRRAEKAVQFPIYDDPERFHDWATTVGSIPPELLQRLEREQPYHRAGALAAQGMVDTLVKLHDFDITDKHRNSVIAVAGNFDLSLLKMTFRGEADELAFDTQGAVRLEDGALLARVTAAHPFELVEFVGEPVTIRFDVPANQGFAPLLEILGTMAGKVRTTLDGLYGRPHISDVPIEGSGEAPIIGGETITIRVSRTDDGDAGPQ